MFRLKKERPWHVFRTWKHPNPWIACLWDTNLWIAIPRLNVFEAPIYELESPFKKVCQSQNCQVRITTSELSVLEVTSLWKRVIAVNLILIHLMTTVKSYCFWENKEKKSSLPDLGYWKKSTWFLRLQKLYSLIIFNF